MHNLLLIFTFLVLNISMELVSKIVFIGYTSMYSVGIRQNSCFGERLEVEKLFWRKAGDSKVVLEKGWR